jgi:hypothetical protein
LPASAVIGGPTHGRELLAGLSGGRLRPRRAELGDKADGVALSAVPAAQIAPAVPIDAVIYG